MNNSRQRELDSLRCALKKTQGGNCEVWRTKTFDWCLTKNPDLYLYLFFFQLVLGIFFSATSFFDIQGLFLILGINIQLKIGVAMVALLIVKFKMDHLERTIWVRGTYYSIKGIMNRKKI